LDAAPQTEHAAAKNEGGAGDLLILALWAGLFGAIAVLVLGYRRKAVIYMDNNDFCMNILPLPLSVIGLLICNTMENEAARRAIIVLTAVIVVIVLAYNFYKSLRFNFFLPIPFNIFVAIVKTLFSTIAIVLIVSWVGNVFDRKKSWRDAAISGLLLALAGALIKHLINGEEVYAVRGPEVKVEQPSGDYAARQAAASEAYYKYERAKTSAPPPPADKKSAWYEILKVKPDASLEEIHSAYIELIRQYHPDLVASLAPEYMVIAERETKILNAAFKEGQLSHRAA
jgi:hypothetical protein